MSMSYFPNSTATFELTANSANQLNLFDYYILPAPSTTQTLEYSKDTSIPA